MIVDNLTNFAASYNAQRCLIGHGAIHPHVPQDKAAIQEKRKMRDKVAGALAAGFMLMASQAMGASYTLDFSGDICETTTGACNNANQISQSYGDVAGEVDVAWDNGGIAASKNVFYWSSGYETLNDVAYGTRNGSGLTVGFLAAAGKEIVLNGFDIAPYLNRDRDSRVQIFDNAGGASLFDTGLFEVSTASVTNYSNPGNWVSSELSIILGPDSWDVGIDNISFDVRDISGLQPTTPIPLPAAGWLLLGGLGALAGLRRTRA
jgi:hypothetical protein